MPLPLTLPPTVPLSLPPHSFNKLYTLEGGIQNYMREEGLDHWNGSLFVFDGRMAIRPSESRHVACLLWRELLLQAATCLLSSFLPHGDSSALAAYLPRLLPGRKLPPHPLCRQRQGGRAGGGGAVPSVRRHCRAASHELRKHRCGCLLGGTFVLGVGPCLCAGGLVSAFCVVRRGLAFLAACCCNLGSFSPCLFTVCSATSFSLPAMPARWAGRAGPAGGNTTSPAAAAGGTCCRPPPMHQRPDTAPTDLPLRCLPTLRCPARALQTKFSGCCCEACTAAPRLLRPAKTQGLYGNWSQYIDGEGALVPHAVHAPLAPRRCGATWLTPGLLHHRCSPLQRKLPCALAMTRVFHAPSFKGHCHTRSHLLTSQPLHAIRCCGPQRRQRPTRSSLRGEGRAASPGGASGSRR